MQHSTDNPLVGRLDAMLEDASMPEIVAALVLLSRAYVEQMRRDGDPEYPGWEAWDHALSAALLQVEGRTEFEDLLGGK